MLVYHFLMELAWAALVVVIMLSLFVRRGFRPLFRLTACVAFLALMLVVATVAYAADPGTAPPATLTALLGVYAWPVWITVASLVTIASTWCAFTKTPDPKTTWGKIYSAIEVVALLVGRAKDPAPLDVSLGELVPAPATIYPDPARRIDLPAPAATKPAGS